MSKTIRELRSALNDNLSALLSIAANQAGLQRLVDARIGRAGYWETIQNSGELVPDRLYIIRQCWSNKSESVSLACWAGADGWYCLAGSPRGFTVTAGRNYRLQIWVVGKKPVRAPKARRPKKS